MHYLKAAFYLVCMALVAEATEVDQCPGIPASRALADNAVSINGCERGRCKLKKRRDAIIEMKFIAQENVNDLVTRVNAEIFGLPLPFVGVDGTSACKNIYSEDGTENVGCPLRAGTAYTYKNSFKVLDVYPKVDLIVHWELATRKGKTIACFQVPAKITN